ncbi:glycerophosphodiester phosphodiesterase [Arenibacter lacus]|uniref:glycerophosphodiester phosphodiesterase n=1 Tax=Arenibacter lacus TaxID=2608629 RepID=UPI001CC53F7F|nr:glycerophosphodiester phosphodiesterase family protein [Arenibacter lacus]
MNTPLVIGHRGAMGHETENTLASVQKALDLEVDMIEIDVFKIRSGEIVVFHDKTVERLTEGTGKIEDYNYEQLQELTLTGGHKIPTLQEVINLMDKKAHLNIELKDANTADRVNFIINYYVREKGWPLDKFLISSFKWEELRRMRTLNPQIGIAVLTDKDPLQAMDIAAELGALAINPYYKTLSLENVDKMQEAGFKVYPYTINEPADIKSMKQMGVDGIITNYPERIN